MSCVCGLSSVGISLSYPSRVGLQSPPTLRTLQLNAPSSAHSVITTALCNFAWAFHSWRVWLHVFTNCCDVESLVVSRRRCQMLCSQPLGEASVPSSGSVLSHVAGVLGCPEGAVLLWGRVGHKVQHVRPPDQAAALQAVIRATQGPPPPMAAAAAPSGTTRGAAWTQGECRAG